MSAARCVVGEWSYECCKVCHRGSGSKSAARCVVGGEWSYECCKVCCRGEWS